VVVNDDGGEMKGIQLRDYCGCIQMYPDKYPWMVDKFLWIWMISMDIHIIHKSVK
jgi:hypothetical protein